MEILQLTYFKALARIQHMTKTAKKLNISQPALSQTIARLEDELGVPLFDRVGRKIRLNQYGEMFLSRVNRASYELEDGKREILDLANILDHSISITVLLPHILPEFIGQLASRFPNAFIQQYSSSRGKTIKQIQNYEVDFCLVFGQINDDNIEWKQLYNEPIYLTVPRNHRLAKRESITLDEAANEPFISYGKEFEFRHLTDKYCNEAGFVPNTTIELEDPVALLKLVELGFGVSFTPQLSTIQKHVADTVQIPISHPQCMRTIGIAWNKNHYLSKIALECKKFIIEFFDELNN